MQTDETLGNFLNEVLPYVLQNLSKIKFKVGIEHSEFTDFFLNQNCSDDLSDLFNDRGRFQQELAFSEYINQKTQAFAAGKLLPLRFKNQNNKNISDIRVFINKKGNHSSLHFDWTFNQNLLVNLFGKKEVLLWGPDFSQDFGGYSNFIISETSKLPPPDFRFSLAENEQVTIPPFWWHKVLSKTDSGSLSIRWGSEKVVNEQLLLIYPTWKFVAINNVDRLRILQDILSQKKIRNEYVLFERIESLLSEALKTKTLEHPFYKRWALGYLRHVRNQ
jgi:hypothetical protein